jgi:hypothetical protein
MREEEAESRKQKAIDVGILAVYAPRAWNATQRQYIATFSTIKK